MRKKRRKKRWVRMAPFLTTELEWSPPPPCSSPPSLFGISSVNHNIWNHWRQELPSSNMILPTPQADNVYNVFRDSPLRYCELMNEFYRAALLKLMAHQLFCFCLSALPKVAMQMRWDFNIMFPCWSLQLRIHDMAHDPTRCLLRLEKAFDTRWVIAPVTNIINTMITPTDSFKYSIQNS